MTLTVSTKVVEETVVVKKEIKTYNLELTEEQMIELHALLGNCSGSLYWDLESVVRGDSALTKKSESKSKEFEGCFKWVLDLS